MQVQGKNLYPLTHSFSSLGGYYMDVDFEVWSTKRGSIAKLLGSRPTNRYGNASGPKYYTLNGMSYSHDQLKSAARFDRRFTEETFNGSDRQPGGYGPKVLSAKTLGVDLKEVKAPIPPLPLPQSLSLHAIDTFAGIMSKGWIIGSFKDGKLSFAREPAIHLSLDSVKAEMARLAMEVPGTKFVRLKIEGTVVSGGVTWE